MKWVLFSMMHQHSKRLPDKLLQKIWTPIGHVSLGEWAAHRLSSMANTLSLDYFVGVSDREFPGLADKHPVIIRSPESLDTEDHVTLHRDIPPSFDGYDWALHVNACCPFLTSETIGSFLQRVESEFPCEGFSVAAAFEENGFVYADGRRLFPPTGEGLSLNTKTNRSFHVPCHAFIAQPAKRLGRVLSPTKGFVSVGSRRSEFLDVDTRDDLEIVQAVCRWKHPIDYAMME